MKIGRPYLHPGCLKQMMNAPIFLQPFIFILILVNTKMVV